MGINPSHFNTGATENVMPIASNPCQDLWLQYSWQDADRVSREDIAREIGNAERDIADYLRWWPAPTWIAEDVKPYPRHHRPDVIQYGGLDVRGYAKSINTDYGYVIAPGQRALTLVDTATVAAGELTYTDLDGDGVNETARVAVTTTLTNACELKVFFNGYSGLPEWEIRPARSKSISGGTLTADFWAWQFILPSLWEALTTPSGADSINWSANANLVISVDVYREYNDTTATSATLYWEPETAALNWLQNAVCTCSGAGTCPACTLTTQDGCLHVRDAEAGVVVPTAATYDSADAQWESSTLSVCRDPDFVKLWYYAGKIDQRRLRGDTCQTLDEWWAQTIAWLATARIERPFCSCANVTALAQDLRTDLALLGRDVSYATTEEVLNNPFGTKKGEVMAWKRVSKFAKKRMRAAVI